MINCKNIDMSNLENWLTATPANWMEPKKRSGVMVLWSVVVIAVTLCSVVAIAQSSLPRSFDSPQGAAKAFYEAVKERNQDKVLAILGPSVKEWLVSGDPVNDRKLAERFMAAYEQKNAIEKHGDRKSVLTVGNDAYPFPFPIMKSGNRWVFDAVAGKEELLARRIGQNELSANKVLLAIVDAQYEYASESRDRSGINQYARKFRSSAGKRDGLYWPINEGEIQSPLGPMVAAAVTEGYFSSRKGNGPPPYHAYYYRILLSQGDNAPGGAMNYILNGRMIGGFAVLAYPAKYGVSGILAFMVHHSGDVYFKDLGPDTMTRVADIQAFNLDSSWQKQTEK